MRDTRFGMKPYPFEIPRLWITIGSDTCKVSTTAACCVAARRTDWL
jgi:hypothetical protein